MHMHMLKRGTRGAIALTTVALLALATGCSSSDSGSAGGSDPNKPVTLSWSIWSSSQEEVAAWKHVGDMVTAKYPNIKMNFTTSSFADHFTKLTADTAAGQANCITGMQSLRVPGFADALIPLNDLMTKYAVNGADFEPSILTGLQANGKQVALPYDFGPLIMLYNADAFTAASVPLPKAGWTTDDFVSAAQALTKDGKFGFSADQGDFSWAPMTMAYNGTQPVDTSGKPALSDPKLVQAFQWYADLVGKLKVAPPMDANSNSINTFLSGKAAMVVDGPWDLINAKAQAKFKLGTVALPGSSSLTAGSGFGITTSCKEPEAAFKAISVITGPEAETYLAEQGRAFPARTAQQDAWFANVPDQKPVLLSALESAQPYRTIKNQNQLDQLFGQYTIPVLNGKETAQSMFTKVAAQLQ